MNFEAMEVLNKYASIHTRVMNFYILNFRSVNREAILKFGPSFLFAPGDLVSIIFGRSQKEFSDLNVPTIIDAFKVTDRKALRLNQADIQTIIALQFALADVSGPKNKIGVLDRLIKVAPEQSLVGAGLLFARAMAMDGIDTIYNLKYLENYGILPYQPARTFHEPPLYLGDEIFDADIIGAVAGGIAGAIAGAITGSFFAGVGAGPGLLSVAAGGMVATGLGNSLEVLLEWSQGRGNYHRLVGKSIFDSGYPYPHGPYDPNGPIGGGGSGATWG